MAATKPTLLTLPLEVQFEVFSYLIPPMSCYNISPMPQTLEARFFFDTHPSGLAYRSQHPFLNLAGSCRSLRTSVESYCRHILQVYKDLDDVRVPQIPEDDWVQMVKHQRKRDIRKRVQTYRLCYLKWAWLHCLFCGRVTTRRAVFNQLIWCCKCCDKARYGTAVVSPGTGIMF